MSIAAATMRRDSWALAISAVLLSGRMLLHFKASEQSRFTQVETILGPFLVAYH